MTLKKGALVISLDFELFYGVRDHFSVADYGKNIVGARKAVMEMLELFQQKSIHATWATVGLLFFDNKLDLIENIPTLKPDYKNKKLSPYRHVQNIGENEKTDGLHFGLSLVNKIKQTEGQEIGSHTFSHFYCLEEGQSDASFCADLECAKKVASKQNIELNSLVFPRNQYDEGHLRSCGNVGFKAFRGNEDSWLYAPRSQEDELVFRRLLRLLDSYFNLSGHHAYSLDQIDKVLPINIPSSRFLRPHSKKLKIFEGFKLRRILSDLTYAAKNNLFYHLWWHPHNFGDNLNDNMKMLNKIVDHYLLLKESFGFESLNMGEVCDEVINGE